MREMFKVIRFFFLRNGSYLNERSFFSVLINWHYCLKYLKVKTRSFEVCCELNTELNFAIFDEIKVPRI